MIFSVLVFGALVTVQLAPHKPADAADALTSSPKRDLLLVGLTQWAGLLFPLWIFVLSDYILVADRRDDIRPVL